MNLFDAKYLFASLIWGSVGVGYFIHGKRQGEMVPLLGGVAMVAVSYFVDSALLMSLICGAVMVGVHQAIKRWP